MQKVSVLFHIQLVVDFNIISYIFAKAHIVYLKTSRCHISGKQ